MTTKWQNLKARKCPKCEAPLEREEKKLVLVCTACPFVITSRVVAEMLSDPTHAIHRFDHPETIPEIRQGFEAMHA